ncbi:cytochrome c [Povalibacter sp.]|uniref:c-type cytochrome n=1 Tax=Povalibacter sp. TaxID=1962978 RepID=UPI002F3F87C8
MARDNYSLAACALIAALLSSDAAHADASQIARGKYLAQLGGCTDCHTPGYFSGKPDSRYLGGSDVGFKAPDGSVVVGPNLTPDLQTGLGGWTAEDIAKALRTGIRPDGRVLSGIMPWPAYANLTPQDMDALIAFLKSLRPVKNKVPGPFSASEAPGLFVMQLTPPAKTSVAR